MIMVTSDSVRELLERAQAGDRPAFESIMVRFRERLCRQVDARLGKQVRGAIDVDDIVQETFLRAFASVRKVKWHSEERLYRWFGGIAEHLIQNAAQKRAPRTLEVIPDRPASSVSPSRRLQREERHARLEKALDGLTPDQKRAVILARIDGLQVQEIARRMERSPDAVSKLLARALLALRQTFGNTESLHLPDRGLRAEGREEDDRGE